jgi:XTP/dITP diphosphohydrolase
VPLRKPILVLASRNSDKLREMRQLFVALPLGEVLSAAELKAPEVVEDGATLEENARKKALELLAFAQAELGAAAIESGCLALADDTGLEVDALDGAPGVFSARYAGAQASYTDNWQKLLAELVGVAAGRRGAQFRTVMALQGQLADGRRVDVTADGSVRGSIAQAPRGSGGFGYDPVFVVDEPSVPQALRGRTLAELSPLEKNRISHRARAAAAMRGVLKELLVAA